MTTNAELTDVLRKISEELWSGYMLDIEKETKTKSSASMILFGGILLTPLLMGGIFSIFGTAFAQEQFQMIVYYVGVFILALAVCVCIMYGIVIGRLKQSIILIAPSMFIAYALYILVSTSTLM
ncbi:MAG: hypothetical protein COS08_03670 [Euryarchaeota archaeon CG01_land_8_20_14_3_00_38_12]|nr:MAG: hypothetical protein COS08_03670 [Euryarchaeota archaeon CG01_land_8_20_14_3_00_38_12]